MEDSLSSQAIPVASEARREVRPSRAVPSRLFWKDALHVFAVFNFAVAYPVLDKLSQDPWFFVVERARSYDVLLLTGFICFVVPGLLVACYSVANTRSTHVRNLVHAFVIAGLLIFGSIYSLAGRADKIDFFSSAIVATLLCVVVTMLYLRFQSLQLFTSFLAISIVVVPANFLLLSGASRIAFPEQEAATASPLSESTDKTIVMVVLDELPSVSLMGLDRQIDRDRYPNIAALTDDSYWFRNASTVSDSTRLALPAMMTGQYPEFRKLPRESDYPDNLFMLLSKTHTLHVSESVTHLCGVRYCKDGRLSVSERLNLLTRGMIGNNVRRAVSNPTRPSHFRRFVESIDSSSSPAFHFHHSLLPHSPWWRLPTGARYSVDERQPLEPWNGAWITTHNHQRHLLQVEYTDHLIGELLDRLKETGVYDEALIVLVADHGASFHPDVQYREVSDETASDIIQVPLIVKLPYQDYAVVSDRNVQVVDILPTIADALDFEIPWEVDGQSAIDMSLPEPLEKVVLIHDTGERLVYGSMLEGVDKSLHRKLNVFGSGDVPGGLFGIGRYSELIGMDVDKLPFVGQNDLDLELNDASLYQDVDLDGDFIPALVEGRLRSAPSGEDDSIHLLVAINDKVRASTQTYAVGGDVRFAAMVPEESFKQGQNEVEILIVSGAEDDPEVWETVN